MSRPAFGKPIQQLLHGYRRGHEQLAGSIKLPPIDADLVRRLSDLSGSLSGTTRIPPYITGYPLPSERFFALAQTWPDKTAARDGCVLTHTLLISMSDWSGCDNPRAFTALHQLPTNVLMDSYNNELYLTESVQSPQAPSSFILESSREFIGRLFQDGLTPLIWLGQPEPEEILWPIIHAIWPKLRARISFCSFCLQPRTIEERPFDFMFAPKESYSRFHQFSREHILDNATKAAPTSSTLMESWTSIWTTMIFDPYTRDQPLEPFIGLKRLLDEEPNSIRILFRLVELRDRSNIYPIAAVGVLDLLSSVAPDPDEAVREKREAVIAAIAAAGRAFDSDESAKCLLLIADRLGHAAFRDASSFVTHKFISALADHTVRTPETILRCAEALLVTDVPDTPAPLAVEAILDGFGRIASESPSTLNLLHHHRDAAVVIVGRRPDIAAAYVRSAKSRGSNPLEARRDLQN